MTVSGKAFLAVAFASMLLPVAAGAQPGAGANPGKDMVAAKCFQCHTDSMFRDGRQDRRGWEATIYRMMGRGGIWAAAEISLGGGSLGGAVSPNPKPAEGKP